MFKVVSAEFKKMLAKPGVYVLAVLLAIILILGAFIYKPVEDQTSSVVLAGETFTEKYEAFTNSNEGLKLITDLSVDDATKLVKNYQINSPSGNITQEENINNAYNAFVLAYQDYRESANNGATQDDINSRIKVNLINKLTTLNEKINSAILNSAGGSYTIIVTENNYDNYNNTYKEIYRWANKTVSKSEISNDCFEFESKYNAKFIKAMGHFIYPTLSANFIKDYTENSENTKYNALQQQLTAITEQINEKYTQYNSNQDKNIANAKEMDDLANKYVDISKTFTNLINYELIDSAFSSCSDADKMDLVYLKHYSSYNNKSLLIKSRYIFENQKTESDYANPLTIGTNSTTKTNGYDFAYFVLKLFSFVIIAYAVMSACHSMAGEMKDGSMRYYAIRPISRNEIFFGKLLAIIFMSIILMLFSSVISLLIGGVLYGFASPDILTIFNSSSVLILHPIGMIAILLLSLLIELIIYTCLAMFISTAIKSDLFSVTLIIMLYLINTVLPLFIAGTNTWLMFYPFSHIALFNLFGSSVYAPPQNFITTILGTHVYPTTSLAVTLTIVILIIGFTTLFTSYIFKKKEL